MKGYTFNGPAFVRPRALRDSARHRPKTFLLVFGVVLMFTWSAPHAQRATPTYEANYKTVHAMLE